jgi:hypothetical protein
MKVLGCMLILGGIAAPYFSACEAQSQMNPGVSDFQALLAALGVRRNLVDLFQMRAGFHGFILLLLHTRVMSSLNITAEGSVVQVYHCLPPAVFTPEGLRSPS